MVGVSLKDSSSVRWCVKSVGSNPGGGLSHGTNKLHMSCISC